MGLNGSRRLLPHHAGSLTVQPMRPILPPPILVVLAALLMWALDRWAPVAQWISSPWNRFGVLVAAGAVAIAVAALVRFRQVGTTVNPIDPRKASHLVTDGVFRFSRNPMYVALVLLLIAWAIWLGSAAPWIGPPLFVIVLTVWQIIPEETALHRLFGEQYVSYRRSVARWIGRRR